MGLGIITTLSVCYLFYLAVERPGHSLAKWATARLDRATSTLQTGAKKITDAENIISVRLSQDNTLTDFGMHFIDKMRIGISGKVKSSAARHNQD